MKRFSIRWLMGLVALLGMAAAAFRYPSQLWTSVLFTLALASIVLAILSAVYLTGDRRAFWVGYAACGGVYLLLTNTPWVEVHLGRRLVTTSAIEMLHALLVPAPPQAPMGGTALGGMMPGMGQGNFTIEPKDVWANWNSGNRNFLGPTYGRSLLPIAGSLPTSGPCRVLADGSDPRRYVYPTSIRDSSIA